MIRDQQHIHTLILAHGISTREDDRVTQRLCLSSTRYVVDFGMLPGWIQYDTDQDAEYFGVWVNPETYQTLSYVEGDWTQTTYAGAAEYNAALVKMNEYYAVSAFAVAVNTESGETTRMVQDRTELFAEEEA